MKDFAIPRVLVGNGGSALVTSGRSVALGVSAATPARIAILNPFSKNDEGLEVINPANLDEASEAFPAFNIGVIPRSLQFVQSSGTNKSIKSAVIDLNKIHSIRIINGANTPATQIHAVGFVPTSGLYDNPAEGNICNTITVEPDKNYAITLRAFSNWINAFHPYGLTRSFVSESPCADTVNCNEVPNHLMPGYVAYDLVAKINADPYMSKYMTAAVVGKYFVADGSDNPDTNVDVREFKSASSIAGVSTTTVHTTYAAYATAMASAVEAGGTGTGTTLTQANAVNGTDFAVGIVLEAKAIDRKGNACDITLFPFEFDGVRMKVWFQEGLLTQMGNSVLGTDGSVEPTLKCDTVPTFLLRQVAYATGSGTELKHLELEAKSYIEDAYKPQFRGVKYNVGKYPFFVNEASTYTQYHIVFDANTPMGWNDATVQVMELILLIDTTTDVTVFSNFLGQVARMAGLTNVSNNDADVATNDTGGVTEVYYKR